MPPRTDPVSCPPAGCTPNKAPILPPLPERPQVRVYTEHSLAWRVFRFPLLFVVVVLLALVLLLGPGLLLGQAEAASSITLRWDAGAGLAPLGYIVERRSGTSVYAEIGRPTTLTYTDTTAPALGSSCWQVRAYNGLGTSGPSHELCLSVPGAPVNLTISTQGPTPTQHRVGVRATVRKK